MNKRLAFATIASHNFFERAQLPFIKTGSRQTEMNQFGVASLIIFKRQDFINQDLAGVLSNIHTALNQQRLLTVKKLCRPGVGFGKNDHLHKATEIFQGDESHPVTLACI